MEVQEDEQREIRIGIGRACKSIGLGVHEEKVAKDGGAVFIAVDVRGKMRGAGRNAEDLKSRRVREEKSE